MGNCNIDPHIYQYMELVESGKIRTCEEQKLLVKLVAKSFETEDIYTDSEQLENYLGLAKYFPFEQLFPWEEFGIGLHLCTYWGDTGRPRWKDMLYLLGRGAGKDGTIAMYGADLTSPYNPIPYYDVDICANNETQAMRPVLDVVEAFNAPRYKQKLKKYYYWTKEKVQGRENRGIVTGHTNNPGGKDGLRSGIVVFNEIHQYENEKNINVFTTGLGKKAHPRRAYFTTQGDVREGPLDEKLEDAAGILRREEPDGGFLPFICKLDSEEEVHDPENWQKANPSLPYRPDLMEEIRSEYVEWKKAPTQHSAFMTKRMNIPKGNKEIEVTDWDNVTATNRELPDLTGWPCTVGIDYAEIRDWVGVNAHFRLGEDRIDINHGWICLQSKDLERIKAPWESWVDMGLLTPIDQPEIPVETIVKYVGELLKTYKVKMLSMDKFRWKLMKRQIEALGFDTQDNKNLYLTRPSDIMCIQPVIDSCFTNHRFIWGNNPMLRWSVGNTKLIRSGKKEGTDTGNYYYGKIEGKSRKTDPFMALVHSMVVEDCLPLNGPEKLPDLGVIVG